MNALEKSIEKFVLQQVLDEADHSCHAAMSSFIKSLIGVHREGKMSPLNGLKTRKSQAQPNQESYSWPSTSNGG